MGENIPQLPPVGPLGAPVASVSKNAFERLTSREFVPHELLSLIEEFLMSENVDRTIRSLAEDDAQAFIDVIDGALDNSELSPWAKTQCLQLLYRTCGLYALLPKTMKIPDCCDRTGVALYRGGYADVWKGKYRGREVAVKVVRTYKNSDLKKILGRFCKEVVTWRTLQHPNVLPLIGVTMSEGQFAMISDWMPHGNINEFVEANPSVNRLKLLGDVARGLIYIHEREMTHGDLKGANILIDQASNARLADFGLLTVLSDPANILPPSSYPQGGTARWMGPELIAPKEFGLKTSRPTKASDCYSLGMVIYEAISGSIPFHEDTDLAVFLKVVRGERPSRGAGFPEGLWEKLEQCWKPHPDARPSVEDVLQCLERCNLPDTGATSTGDSVQGTQTSTGTGHDGGPRGSEGLPGTSARGEIIVQCVCGDDSDGEKPVVQCNECMVRQHARCMRFEVRAHNIAYFCKQCRPGLRQDFLRNPSHQHSNSIGGMSGPQSPHADLLAHSVADTTVAGQPSTIPPLGYFNPYVSASAAADLTLAYSRYRRGSSPGSPSTRSGSADNDSASNHSGPIYSRPHFIPFTSTSDTDYFNNDMMTSFNLYDSPSVPTDTSDPGPSNFDTIGAFDYLPLGVPTDTSYPDPLYTDAMPTVNLYHPPSVPANTPYPDPLYSDVMTNVNFYPPPRFPISLPAIHPFNINFATASGPCDPPSELTKAERDLSTAGKEIETVSDDRRKKYKCPDCPRTFARVGSLKSHRRTHEPRSHMCPHSSCGRSFSRKHNLDRHVTDTHRSSPIEDPRVGVERGSRSRCGKCGKSWVGDQDRPCNCNNEVR